MLMVLLAVLVREIDLVELLAHSYVFLDHQPLMVVLIGVDSIAVRIQSTMLQSVKVNMNSRTCSRVYC